MMKHEFIEIAKNEFIEIAKIAKTSNDISDEHYAIIEKVYLYHPAINDINAKQKIANLYNQFGMLVIRDMLPLAEKIGKLEHEIFVHKAEIDTIKNEIELLSKI